MKVTAQMIKMDLQKNHPKVLEHFYVGIQDRLSQTWKRNSPGIDIKIDKVFNQKLDYIHQNPVKAGLCPFAISMGLANEMGRVIKFVKWVVSN